MHFCDVDSAEIIFRYFPSLTARQKEQFALLRALYEYWNSSINVISRKDMEAFYERHVLHSLAIAKFQPFAAGNSVLDVGTGGGFPGIPLAICFPEKEFILVDSIGKKIKVVEDVARQLELKNLSALNERAENVEKKVDFVVSRATALFGDLVKWTRSSLRKGKAGGIIALKGGDLEDELKSFPTVIMKDISSWFAEPFFESKKLVYWPSA